MKTIRCVFAAAALAAVSAATLPAQSVDALFSKGERAYFAGDIETAKAKFEQVLKADPKNLPAQHYLAQILAASKEDPKVALQAKLKKIVLPKVEFREATLDAVLDFLRESVEQVSKGETKINFVVSLSPAQQRERKVNLRLQNVPASEVLRYVSDLASLDLEFQQHAILVKPRGSSDAQ